MAAEKDQHNRAFRDKLAEPAHRIGAVGQDEIRGELTNLRRAAIGHMHSVSECRYHGDMLRSDR